MQELLKAGRGSAGEPVNEKDTLFQSPSVAGSEFTFDDRVVRVFPDMIRRSVPGYALVVPLTALLARRYAQDASLLYDLGCSLGAVSLAMSDAVRARNSAIVAVDNSAPMIDGLKRVLADREAPGAVPIQPRCADLRDTEIVRASFVVLNFTLQFIEPAARAAVLGRIRAGLLDDGALVLSEKVRFESPEEQALQTEWHHAFKRAQGYSELEIARKRDALDRVLKPDTMTVLRQRLCDAGFSRVYQWYQGFSFVSLIAFK
jgi:tRNA (cmo5U34)-methyltransferase